MQKLIYPRLAGIFTAVCLLAFAQSLSAQATLSIQGIIRKSNGAAVDDGKYDLTFKLYNTTSGGTALHTETQNVSVTGGIYSAELGGGSTPLNAAFDQTYYLGVSVDGGAELVPRARLTSSPYALSLLGTTNLFPGSGAVGAGTITPASGYQMHIANGSGAGKLLVEGSTAAQVDFKKGNTAGSIGFGTSNNDFVVNPGSNNTLLQYNGNTKLTVNNDGVNVNGTLTASNFTYNPSQMTVSSKLAVGQNSVDANNALKVTGNTLMAGFLEITGQVTTNSVYGAGSFVGRYCYNGLCGGTTGNFSASIKAHGSIYTGGDLFVNSDSRIKKDIKNADVLNDLALLKKMRVDNYRFKDEINKGTEFTNGLIAQEVKSVFPQAVSLTSDFLPTVYELASKLALDNKQLVISTAKAHDFVVGDEVKLIMPDDSEQRATVKKVVSPTSFSVEWGNALPEQIFVYGKKVNDFHSVDYDRVFMLNVSATQELARQVEELKKENAALKSENGTLKSEMKASAEKFDARLRALENKLSN